MSSATMAVHCLAAAAMPEPGGAIVVFVVTCGAWFGIVSFLGGYLIKKEIGDHLKDGGASAPLRREDPGRGNLG